MCYVWRQTISPLVEMYNRCHSLNDIFIPCWVSDVTAMGWKRNSMWRCTPSPLCHRDTCLDFNWLTSRYMLYRSLCVFLWLPLSACLCVAVCSFVIVSPWALMMFAEWKASCEAFPNHVLIKMPFLQRHHPLTFPLVLVTWLLILHDMWASSPPTGGDKILKETSYIVVFVSDLKCHTNVNEMLIKHLKHSNLSSGFGRGIFSWFVAYFWGHSSLEAPIPFSQWEEKLRIRHGRLHAAETIFRPPN